MPKSKTDPPPEKDERRQKIQRKKADPKKPRVAANGYRLPEPIPFGEILTDVYKRKWKIGKSIGVGGFGEIYLASDDVSEPLEADAKYVIKIEPHENGPLFTEMHFYLRVAKEEYIDSWMKKKKLKFLGLPEFVASGSHECNGIKYRFMVIQRFGNDLQKLLIAQERSFSTKTVLCLGIKILDVLEYIHSSGYVHADIKASNLLMGYNDESFEKVYLVDFGLACPYAKEYKPDPRKAHNGTLEFTSRDAHVGVPSRRGDLEILGYNLLHWSGGKLPWEEIKNPNQVKEMKNQYLNDVANLVKDCCLSTPPIPAIKKYLEYVGKLHFEEEPNYDICRQLLREGLKKVGLKDDGKLDLSKSISETKTSRKKIEKRKPEIEDDSTANAKPLRTRRNCKKDPSTSSENNQLKDDLNVELHNEEICNPTPQMLEVIEMRKRRENLLKTNKRKKVSANRRQMPSTENFNVSPDLF